MTFRESMGNLLFALALGVIFAYMVLASQFNSFLHPITVLTILPLSLAGAAFALFITGQTLNIFSMIGLLLLMGIVKKNSIILVDYANQLREEGQSPIDAIRHAAPIRMRPVVMTALAMIFGVLPAAFGLGPGAETRRPMAIATAAGMFTSTLLTLLVVPVFYLALDDVKAFFRSPREALARGRAALRGLRPLAARYLGSGS